MILYVNGDSHSAGAELATSIHGQLLSFKEDDSTYWRIIGTEEGRQAHPKCLELSYGQILANKLGAEFACEAISGASNSRIHRTTMDFLKRHRPDLVVIGWSTWEREEWIHDNRWYQISAGGVGEDWPEAIKDRYKQWIVELNYQAMMNKMHRSIHNLHHQLSDMGVNHFFFTCYESFSNVEPLDWNQCYLDPYNPDMTYFNWCKQQGFKTVRPDGYHYGADAHQAWAEFLYPQIVQSCLKKK